MKPRLLCLVLPLLLNQCKAINAIGGGALPSDNARVSPGKSGTTHARSNERAQAIYQQGKKDGQLDHTQGKSPSYGRHVTDFDESTEDAFSAGYEAGYFGTP